MAFRYGTAAYWKDLYFKLKAKMGSLTRTVSPQILTFTATATTGQIALAWTTKNTLGTTIATLTRSPAFAAPVTPTGLSYTDTTVIGGTLYTYTLNLGDSRSLNAVALQASGTPPSGAGGFTANSGFGGSGSFTDGGSITISGTGFGTKANVKPLWYFPLESNFSAHATWSRNAGSLNPDSSATIQTSVMPTHAAGAARTRACTSSKQSPAPIIFQNGFSFSTKEIYCFVKRRYAHTQPANLKNFRLWPSSVGSIPDFYFAHGDINVSYCESIDTASFTDGGRFHGLGWTQNGWVTDEHHFKQSALNTIDGIWNLCRNGALVYPNTQRWKSRATGMSGDMVQGFFDEYSNDSLDSFVYHHSLYIDDSPKRVFVSDEAAFSTATSGVRNREICIPTAWSDTSISAVLRQGSHTTLAGKYLYVATDHHTAVRIGQFTS